MEGAEHYYHAEQRLVSSDYARQTGDMKAAMHEAAAAQVHATLALAAATAGQLVHKMCGDSNRITEWGNVINWDNAPRPRCTGAQILSDGGVERCHLHPGHEGDHDFHNEPPF